MSRPRPRPRDSLIYALNAAETGNLDKNWELVRKETPFHFNADTGINLLGLVTTGNLPKSVKYDRFGVLGGFDF